jgi:hypothetical protein
MKRLLVLLLVTLVMGSATSFSGPVHINGPGILIRDATATLFEGFILADVAFVMIDAKVIGESGPITVISRFDVTSTFAGNLQGFFDNNFFSIPDSPIMFSAIFANGPDSKKFVLGDNGQSREVISLRGSSKPTYTVNESFV